MKRKRKKRIVKAKATFLMLDPLAEQYLKEMKAMFFVMQDHIQYIEDILVMLAQLRSAPQITIQPPPKKMEVKP